MSSDTPLEKLRFMSEEQVKEAADKFGTPVFVYGQSELITRARQAKSFPNAYGLTVRFAMKSCPNAAILQTFMKEGFHIDASSGYECRRAMAAGFPAESISLSTQELPPFFAELINQGVKLNACSLSQLEAYGKAFPGTKVGVRFNPGKGSGGTGKTNVGGPSSSFGIWHELLPQVKELVEKYDLTVERVHTHIGSGSDPAVWQFTSGLSLDLVAQFPTCRTLNLGGGYKVGRMADEVSTDMLTVGEPVKELFVKFAEEHGTELQLEIEPGTFLVANSGAVVSTIQDKVVTTGEGGQTFLKLDTGMTDVLRPSLYGARHPLIVVPKEGATAPAGAVDNYVVVGHCCESGDLVTPAAGQSEVLEARPLAPAKIGDLMVIEGSGAYCSGMSTKNYNSFPESPEAFLDTKGNFHIIRKRQEPEQIYENEVPLPPEAFE
eukprot:CAMPEP_0113943934 /NCGR_PEP_ID=MMETSP1339-20121228/29690_1 /TAXON_ID=94617 /ORGANISM="Fibrocapsa japonica" /LENGTH=434 /DNA_ID=CAMNT_0000948943 /DNA_START=163 /DNA_END=1467 /DNA_ORIENTATION=+ /assembly_acc=CAM_ASM_000762